MYFPAVDVLTEPDIDIDDVIFPSPSSVAVALGSAKVSPTVRVIVEEPVKAQEITGTNNKRRSSFFTISNYQYNMQILLIHDP